MRTRIKTVHLKRRDYACPYCPGVAFGQKSTLKTVHETRRDHACPYCKGAAFKTKSHLTRHMKTLHKN